MFGTFMSMSRERNPKSYFPIPLAQRWSGRGPIGDESAAFFFSKELGVGL